MNRRFFTRVDINPLNPEPRGICDRCGQQVTLSAMRWQHQYQGGSYKNTKWLVCSICHDIPSPFLKVLQLPADPLPIFNSRPELYAIDENNPWKISGTFAALGGISASLNWKVQFIPAATATSIVNARLKLGALAYPSAICIAHFGASVAAGWLCAAAMSATSAAGCTLKRQAQVSCALNATANVSTSLSLTIFPKFLLNGAALGESAI